MSFNRRAGTQGHRDKSLKVKQVSAKAVVVQPGRRTATEMGHVAEIIVGYILRVGHWGLAIISLGFGFAVVALVTRLDAPTRSAMRAPEFITCLAFSAVVIFAGAWIHVGELRWKWTDPYEVTDDSAAEAADGNPAMIVEASNSVGQAATAPAARPQPGQAQTSQ